MGLFDGMKARIAQRREAEARQRTADDAQVAARLAEDEARTAAYRAMTPSERVQQPAWAGALVAAGITADVVHSVIDGDGGTINSPGSSSIGMPNMRHVTRGAVVLTHDARLAYVVGDGAPDVVVRQRTDVAQMRKANMDGSVWVVFEGDRSFPDRGGQIGRADSWEIRAPDRNPDFIRGVFQQAGFAI